MIKINEINSHYVLLCIENLQVFGGKIRQLNIQLVRENNWNMESPRIHTSHDSEILTCYEEQLDAIVK
jgi:hypothetical protein